MLFIQEDTESGHGGNAESGVQEDWRNGFSVVRLGPVTSSLGWEAEATASLHGYPFACDAEDMNEIKFESTRAASKEIGLASNDLSESTVNGTVYSWQNCILVRSSY